jgi:hypothetical protein
MPYELNKIKIKIKKKCPMEILLSFPPNYTLYSSSSYVSTFIMGRLLIVVQY